MRIKPLRRYCDQRLVLCSAVKVKRPAAGRRRQFDSCSSFSSYGE